MYVETLGEGDPEVAVVGGIHGDEPCGVRAVETLVEEAPAVERPTLLVIANEAAAAQGLRYVDEDLNRAFPGDPGATTHEGRLAAALADRIAECTTLALHSTQSYGGMFALVDAVDDLARSVCPRLSVDAVVETGAAEGRIFAAVPDAIEVECGRQGTDRAAENAVQVAREFLGATGAVPEWRLDEGADRPLFELGEPIPKPAARRYEVFASNFETVGAGDPVAATDDERVIAEEPFAPVLLSAEGYEDVFGYRGQRVGTLSPDA
ncbi:MAG: succinylglutamate desuccinylase/aspartoacylase family protein [Haloarculaceae archaeon]